MLWIFGPNDILIVLDKKHINLLLCLLDCFLFNILSGLIFLFLGSGLSVLIPQFQWCCFVILLEVSF